MVGYFAEGRSNASGKRIAVVILLLGLTLLACTLTARAQTETVLYGFTTAPDGSAPGYWPISDSSGDLFGTTGFGGLGPCYYGCGTVFELVKLASGYTERQLYSFSDSPAIGDGDLPSSGFIMDAAGNLYGVTKNGSALSGPNGTVYEMVKSSTGYSYRHLYSFGPAPDGAQPGGNLVMDAAGDLFGTTSVGGTGDGGTVFELAKSTTGYKEHVLYNSPSLNVGMNLGLAMDSSGDLFGTTPYGGDVSTTCPGGCGVVFELVNSSGTYTYKLLYNFTEAGGDGAQPENNLLIDGSGNLYGFTLSGGTSNLGTLFELQKSSSGYTEKVLYSFGGGPQPDSEGTGMTMDAAGDFFGYSPVVSTPGTWGSAFEMVKSASGYSPKVLWTFQGVPVDGAESCSALTQDSLGHLYGTCSSGGANAAGVVFEIDPGATPTGVTLSPLSVNFAPQRDGTAEVAQLVRLTNNTSSTVTISDISVTGADATDFGLTVSPVGTTCSTTNSTWSTGATASSVPAGGMCGIFPYFTPSVTGNETATLNVSDSGGAQAVALTGTGYVPDFTLGLAPGTSASSTVSPGEIARYTLTLTPLDGFNQAIALSCTGTPARSGCTVSPSSVTLDGTNAQNVAVWVTTTTPSLAGPGPSDGPAAPGPYAINGWWVILLLLIGSVAFAFRRRGAPLMAGAVLLAAIALSCGGSSGGGSGAGGGNPGTPAGTYTVTVTGSSTGLQHSTTLTLTVQ